MQYVGESDEQYLRRVLGDGAVEIGLELGIPLESIEEYYIGNYESDAKFAEEYIKSLDASAYSKDWISQFIDWDEVFGHDWRLFVEEEVDVDYAMMNFIETSSKREIAQVVDWGLVAKDLLADFVVKKKGYYFERYSEINV